MKKEDLAFHRNLLGNIKTRVRQGQHRAALSANAEMIAMYWDIGRMIAAKQKEEGWGAGIIPRLAADLKNELPGLKGFSERNIGYMIRFAREYDSSSILQRSVAKLMPQPVALIGHPEIEAAEILQQPAAKLKNATMLPILQRSIAKLPWGINIALMEKIEHLPTRLWYAEKALQEGWSRDTLTLQIKNRAH